MLPLAIALLCDRAASGRSSYTALTSILSNLNKLSHLNLQIASAKHNLKLVKIQISVINLFIRLNMIIFVVFGMKHACLKVKYI